MAKQPKIKSGAVDLSAVDAITLNGAVAGTNGGDLVQLTGSPAGLPAVDGSNLTGVVSASSAFRGARIYRSGSVSYASGGLHIVQYNVESYDTEGTIVTLGGGSPPVCRLTVPAGVSKISLTVQQSWATNGVGYRQLFTRKNGINYTEMITIGSHGNSVGIVAQTGHSGVFDVSPGDYFQVIVAQTSGGALSTVTLPPNDFFQMTIVE